MKTTINFILRHSAWISLIFISILLLNPIIAEFRTLLLITAFEAVAIFLSGFSVYVFTKIDFINEQSYSVLGYIFLSVHILTGMTVLGVYLAQFGG